MNYSESIKPVSYVKVNIAKIIRQLNEGQEPMIVTQNGEAKAVVIDIKQYEQMQETLAILQMIAQGDKSLAEGEYRPAKDAFRELKNRMGKELPDDV